MNLPIHVFPSEMLGDVYVFPLAHDHPGDSVVGGFNPGLLYISHVCKMAKSMADLACISCRLDIIDQPHRLYR